MAGQSFEGMQRALTQIRVQVRKELTNLKNRVIARMTTEHMSGPTGPASVRARSGRLRGSLNGTVATWGGANKMQLTMFFGGGVPYARIHEYGGTILPKRAKNLAIPVGKALYKSGVSKHGKPSNIWAALRFVKNKKTGKKLLVEAGRGKKLNVLFVLVPSVTLPPRLNFGKTFREEAQRTMNNIAQIQVRPK